VSFVADHRPTWWQTLVFSTFSLLSCLPKLQRRQKPSLSPSFPSLVDYLDFGERIQLLGFEFFIICRLGFASRGGSPGQIGWRTGRIAVR
jgi:hypothetical protein